MLPQRSRRSVLKMLCAGAGAAGLAGVAGCGLGPSGQIPAGNVADVAVGTLRAIPDEMVVIARDDGGLYAMTTICPHEPNDIQVDGQISSAGLRCARHGATFDANGHGTGGPTRSSLEHFQVLVDANGDIIIDADTPVDAAVRTDVASAA